MGTRNWRYYTEPGEDEIKIGRMASGAYDTQLTRGVCANYAEARRNVLNLVYNIDTYKIPLVGPEGNEWWQFVDIPIGGRITRPGELWIYIFTESTAEGGANAIDCHAFVGSDEQRVDISSIPPGGERGTHKKIAVTLTGSVCNPGERLKLLFKTIGANNINIYGVSCFQPKVAASPTFVDLDDANCVLGDADFPDDVFGMKLLRDNTVAVRNYKVPKANVWCQWFGYYYKTDANYSTWGGTNNDLGDYMFVKRAGVSEVKCHFYAYETSGVAGCDVRMEITDPLAALTNPILPAANQTQVVIGGFTWYTLTWTFQGVDITDEFYLRFKIDGRDNAGAGTETVYVPGVYLVETAPSAAIAHTVPDTLNTKMHSDIEAAEIHDNARTTLNHIYYQGGKQILIGDWRFSDYYGYSAPWTLFTTQFLCQNGWACGFAGDPAVFNNSCAARGLLYSSTGSTKLRTRFEYSTDLVANKTKQIQISLSDTLGRGIANYYDADPFYDLNTNNLHDVTKIIDRDTDYYMGLDHCELDIRPADWEEHYDGVNEPPCVHVNCKSDAGGATGYIIPLHFSCEECELHPTDFP